MLEREFTEDFAVLGDEGGGLDGVEGCVFEAHGLQVTVFDGVGGAEVGGVGERTGTFWAEPAECEVLEGPERSEVGVEDLQVVGCVVQAGGQAGQGDVEGFNPVVDACRCWCAADAEGGTEVECC